MSNQDYFAEVEERERLFEALINEEIDRELQTEQEITAHTSKEINKELDEDRCDNCNIIIEGAIFLENQKILCYNCMKKEGL